jgi:hypothetical protein
LFEDEVTRIRLRIGAFSVSLHAELVWDYGAGDIQGRARRMQSGRGEGSEILDMGELSRAVMASESEPTVMDFAPPNSPHRIQRVAELTGASIRRTCADAGRAIIELIDQADAVVRQLREDANAFVQSLDEIGNAHAARIERALTHLRGLVETIGAERRRMIALADTHQTGGNELSDTSLGDASEKSGA